MIIYTATCEEWDKIRKRIVKNKDIQIQKHVGTVNIKTNVQQLKMVVL